jgi:hypothetical protein
MMNLTLGCHICCLASFFFQNKQIRPWTFDKGSSSSLIFWNGQFSPLIFRIRLSYILRPPLPSTASGNAWRTHENEPFALLYASHVSVFLIVSFASQLQVCQKKLEDRESLELGSLKTRLELGSSSKRADFEPDPKLVSSIELSRIAR